MGRKRFGWWLVAAVLVLVGAVTLAVAHEETEQEGRTRSLRWIAFDGHARLGVRVSDVTAEKVRRLKLAGEAGAAIDEVDEDSPAAKAGLEAGDVIVTFDGERVRSVEHLRRLVRETPPGRTVTVQVSRDGQTRSVQVTPEARHARVEIPEIHIPKVTVPRLELPEFDLRILGRGPRLGITGDELTPQLAEYFGVEQGKGVLVREVLTGSAADRAGLKAGDVIVAVDDKPLATVGELRRALRRAGDDNQVSLTFVRDRRQQTITVTLDEPKVRSPSHVAYVIGIDPEIGEGWAAEMREAARDWKRALEEWQREFQQSYREQEREWRDELRVAEKELRQELESEEFQEEKRKLRDEIRWRFRLPEESDTLQLL